MAASTTVTVYSSTDGSAPVLTGQFGAILTVLDGCLVNGYGSKPAAGWTKPFTGTNKAVYRQGGGNGFYLRVKDDTRTFISSNVDFVDLNGYETMSSVDVGTEPFPKTGSATVAKHDDVTGSSEFDAIPWMVIADDRTIYFFNYLYPAYNKWEGWTFGDIFSNRLSDGFRTVLTDNQFKFPAIDFNDGISATNSISRSYTNVSNSSPMIKFYGNSAWYLVSGSTVSPYPHYPNEVGSTLFLNHMDVCEPLAPAVRGRFRGCWLWMHPLASVSDGDTFDGTGDLAGKSFLIVNMSNVVKYALETSSTWETN